MPAVRTFLDLSVGHLSPETHRWLQEQGEIAAACRYGNDRMPAVHVASHVYGWWLWANEHSADPALRPSDVPADLWQCMAYARAAGCDYVLFDADADVDPNLPVFEHR